MPRHHFGFSAVGGLADIEILTIAPFPRNPKAEIGVSGLSVAYGTLKSHC
jgi:hypothetical protein